MLGTEPSCPKRESEKLVRFTAIALKHARNVKETTVIEELNSRQSSAWKIAMVENVHTTQCLNFWNVEEKLHNQHVFYLDLVSRRKRNGNGSISKY